MAKINVVTPNELEVAECIKKAVFLTHALWSQLRDAEKLLGDDVDGLQELVSDLAAGSDHFNDIQTQTIIDEVRKLTVNA